MMLEVVGKGIDNLNARVSGRNNCGTAKRSNALLLTVRRLEYMTSRHRPLMKTHNLRDDPINLCLRSDQGRSYQGLDHRAFVVDDGVDVILVIVYRVLAEFW